MVIVQSDERNPVVERAPITVLRGSLQVPSWGFSLDWSNHGLPELIKSPRLKMANVTVNFQE
jgi:hypothetical protein